MICLHMHRTDQSRNAMHFLWSSCITFTSSSGPSICVNTSDRMRLLGTIPPSCYRPKRVYVRVNYWLFDQVGATPMLTGPKVGSACLEKERPLAESESAGFP